ncbi:unnamed protein product [Ixodes pacificus]
MGHLPKLVSSENDIAFHILSRIFLQNNFRQLLSMASEEVREHCSQKTMKRNATPELLGKAKPALPDVTHLLQQNLEISHSVEECNRVQVYGCVIHSEQYKSALKRDSTAVKVGDDYAKVERILCVQKADSAQEEVYILSFGYHIDCFENVDHLKIMLKSGAMRLYLLTEDVRPCVHLAMEYIIVFAKLCDRHGWS